MIRVGTASPFSQVGGVDCGQNNNGQVCDFRCEAAPCAGSWGAVISMQPKTGLGNVNTPGPGEQHLNAADKNKNKVTRQERLNAAYAKRDTVCGGSNGCVKKPITIPGTLYNGFKETKANTCCYGLK